MPLLVCATPIGNLEDVTHRVIRALRDADLVVCEDTRRTSVLLQRYEIEARLVSFDQHQEERRIQELLPRLERGETLALVSDAGLPGLNDPGGRFIAAAQRDGYEVTVLPGPTAIETALLASGFVGARFTFVGFLPRREAERAQLWRETAGWAWPVVAFESPQRLPKSLESLASFDAARPLAVCRELTKLHEEVVRGSATELASHFETAPKGEVTVVLGPPRAAVAADERAAVLAVKELVAAGVARRRAAGIAATLAGLAANDLYRGSLSD